MLFYKFSFSNDPKFSFGPEAQILILSDKQPQLVGKVILFSDLGNEDFVNNSGVNVPTSKPMVAGNQKRYHLETLHTVGNGYAKNGSITSFATKIEDYERF